MALQTIDKAGIAVDEIRQDFPMLERSIHGKPLLYLDNAGSSLRPRSVLDRNRKFYEFEYVNANEENSLSRNATRAVSDVRSPIVNLLGASSPEEIVLLRSATEAIKLVAYAFKRSQLKPGDQNCPECVHPDAPPAFAQCGPGGVHVHNTEDECDRLCESLLRLS